LPLLVTASDTRTVIKDGTVSGGCGLFPGPVVHVSPQVGVAELKDSANPLNDAGAVPAVSTFSFHQEWLHHVTVSPDVAAAAVPSPRTNAPKLGKAGPSAEATLLRASARALAQAAARTAS
jgi:hypothetical protein